MRNIASNAKEIRRVVLEVRALDDKMLTHSRSCNLIRERLMYQRVDRKLFWKVVDYLQQDFVEMVANTAAEKGAKVWLTEGILRNKSNAWFLDRVSVILAGSQGALPMIVTDSRNVYDIRLELRKNWLDYLAEHLEELANGHREPRLL